MEIELETKNFRGKHYEKCGPLISIKLLSL